ncbi:MAG TPA: phosphotransferase [Segeticoccus sp.]|uniref:phosphotransferase n=1 Tax=Segeticoccus sp. TaxID=2706531 RepID=UPI002D7EEECF|nr:phosphotransferase [Segeticoccus sp.]HET8602053.1 phosphotransferase [Segeticoccus sp.]
MSASTPLGPLALAALASSAVPGLDPQSVQEVRPRHDTNFETARIEDTEHRRWVLRAPLTAAAGAQQEAAQPLLRLVARRLPFAVPVARGFAPVRDRGRAMVYPQPSGHPLDWAALPAGTALAAEVGRAIAALHNLDPRIYEEAGLPSYDAEEYRTRLLAEVDRGAATGRVPTGLLTRWEHALEEVGLWRFGATPTHGNLLGEHVLADFPNEQDAGVGRVRAVTGWERAQVADPADDFASLVSEADPEAFDTVYEAYAHARIERPDQHLEHRARLAGELRLLTALLEAVAADDSRLVDARSSALRRLEEQTEGEDLIPSSLERPSGRITPVPLDAEADAGDDVDARDDAPHDPDTEDDLDTEDDVEGPGAVEGTEQDSGAEADDRAEPAATPPESTTEPHLSAGQASSPTTAEAPERANGTEAGRSS